MRIKDLQHQSSVLDIKQLAYIKGGNDTIITQDNYIGDIDTDVF